MKTVIQKKKVNGGISYTITPIENTCSNYSVRLRITLFSTFCTKADISFMYRENDIDGWKTDACLTFSSGCNSVRDNIIIGANCSPDGAECEFIWEYSENKISNGQQYELKLEIIEQPIILSYNLDTTFQEKVSNNDTNNIEIDDFCKIVGYNTDGKKICVKDTSIAIIDNDTGADELSIFPLTTPVYALQKNDGNYIILVDGGSKIEEYTSQNVYVRGVVSNMYFNESINLVYNDDIQTILIAGANRHFVTEISWQANNFGTILWNYGDGVLGNSPDRLSSPLSAAYDPSNYGVIYIADTGNNRVIKVNRDSPSLTTIIDKIEIGDNTIDLLKPIDVSMTNGILNIIEKEQKSQLYSEDKSSHPSIIRYQNNGLPSSPNNENSVPEYGNMLFTPLLRAIE